MKEVPLTSGFVALVDDGDFDRVASLTWRTHSSAGRLYASRAMYADGRYRSLYLHRFIVGLDFGDPRHVDHEDGDGLNNVRGNLRICSRSQNFGNSGPRKQNTSGFKGIWRSSRPGRWKAACAHRFLGTFASPSEAAYAYDRAAVAHYGPFARLNFPQEITPHEHIPNHEPAL